MYIPNLTVSSSRQVELSQVKEELREYFENLWHPISSAFLVALNRGTEVRGFIYLSKRLYHAYGEISKTETREKIRKCMLIIIRYLGNNFWITFPKRDVILLNIKLEKIDRWIDSVRIWLQEWVFHKKELGNLLDEMSEVAQISSIQIWLSHNIIIWWFPITGTPITVSAILDWIGTERVDLDKLTPLHTRLPQIHQDTAIEPIGPIGPELTFHGFAAATTPWTTPLGLATTPDSLNAPHAEPNDVSHARDTTHLPSLANATPDVLPAAVLDDTTWPQTDDQVIRSRNIWMQGISQLRSSLSGSINDKHLRNYLAIGKDWQGGHWRFGIAGRITEIRMDLLSQGIWIISNFTEAIAFWKEVLKNTKPIANPNNLVEWRLVNFLNNRMTQIRNKLLLDLSAYIQDTLTESFEVIPLLSLNINSTIKDELTRGLSRWMRMLRDLEAPEISASSISTLLDEVSEIIRWTQIVINHSLALWNDTQPATTVWAVGSTVWELRSTLNNEPQNNVAYRGLPPTEWVREVTHPIAKTGQEIFNDWASDSLLQGMGTSGHALVSKPNTSEITPEAPPAPAPASAPVEKPIYLRDCLESYSYQDTEIILQTSIGSLRVLDFKETGRPNCMKIRFQNINSKSISTYAVNLNHARVGMPEITGIEWKFAINYVLLWEYDTDGEIREIQKTWPNWVRRPVAGLHVTIDSIEIRQIPEKENLWYHLGYLTPENPVVLNAGKEDELRMIDLPPYDKKFKDGTFRFEKDYKRVTIQRKSKSTGWMTTDIYVIDIHAARIWNTKSMFKWVYVDGVLKLFQNQYIIDSIHSWMIREKVAKTRGSIWWRVTSLFSSGENSKEPEVIKQTQAIIPAKKPDQNIPTTMPIALEPPILLRPQPSLPKSPSIPQPNKQPQSTPQPPTSWVKNTIQSAWNIVSRGWNKLFGGNR